MPQSQLGYSPQVSLSPLYLSITQKHTEDTWLLFTLVLDFIFFLNFPSVCRCRAFVVWETKCCALARAVCRSKHLICLTVLQMPQMYANVMGPGMSANQPAVFPQFLQVSLFPTGFFFILQVLRWSCHKRFLHFSCLLQINEKLAIWVTPTMDTFLSRWKIATFSHFLCAWLIFYPE